MKYQHFVLVVMAMLFALTSVAQAHFVWVVRNGDRIELRFSESGESVEPELLKKITSSKAWERVPGDGRNMQSREIALTLEGDTLSGTFTDKAQSVLVSCDYGVVTKGDATFQLKYLAKTYLSPLPGDWKAAKDTEHLPIEITPQWSGSKLVLTVSVNGQATEGLEVASLGCGAEETLKTDAKGQVTLEPKSSGLLSVRAKFAEAASGEVDGKKFDSVRTYSTLTLPVSMPAVQPVTHKLAPLPAGITSFGAAIAGDFVYVYGGQVGGAHHYFADGQSGDLLRLSLKSEAAGWEKLAGGPRLTGLAMVEYGGKLYRVGGFMAKNKEDEDQSLWSQDGFACFDPATGAWTELPPMPAGRSSHDAAVIDGKLYVVGGWNMQGPDTTWHTTALCCDLTQSELKWTELPAPEFTRRAVSLAENQGKLYVIGGMTDSDEITMAVSVFDPETQKWSDAPAMLGSGMEGFGTSSFSANGRLIVTGMSGAVQMLREDGSGWDYAGQIAESRFFHRQLTTADGKILIVGGSSMQAGKRTSVELLQFAGR